MFTVAICDDDKIVLSSIQKCIEEFATENNISISVDLYDSGKKLLESSPKYNVIFLEHYFTNRKRYRYRYSAPKIECIYIYNLYYEL